MALNFFLLVKKKIKLATKNSDRPRIHHEFVSGRQDWGSSPCDGCKGEFC